MAGDWIKLEAGTPNKREILRMARKLGLSRDDVLGKVIRFWIWADANTVDGHVDGLASTDVDALVEHEGFAAALEDVGWLSCDDRSETLTIPGFDRHQGDSAKNRALRNERQRRWRSGNVDEEPSTSASTREQKRRVNNTPPRDPPSQRSRRQGQRLPEDFQLTDERLKIATDLGLSNEQAQFEFEKFTDHWKAASGQNARKLDWDATWRNWCRRSTEHRQHRTGGGNGLDEVAWANLLQHVRDGHSLDQVTQADPALAKTAEWLGGMSKLRRMTEHEINRERGKFTGLYRQAQQQETGYERV